MCTYERIVRTRATLYCLLIRTDFLVNCANLRSFLHNDQPSYPRPPPPPTLSLNPISISCIATLVRPALRNGFPAVQQVAYKSGNYQASGGTSLQDGMEPGQFPGNPLGQVDPNAGRFDGGADEGGKGHWIKERWLSVALIPLFPGAYMFPGPVADTLLALMYVYVCVCVCVLLLLYSSFYLCLIIL